jgi:hypothetical protein
VSNIKMVTVEDLKTLGFVFYENGSYIIGTYGDKVGHIWPLSYLEEYKEFNTQIATVHTFRVYGFETEDTPNYNQLLEFTQLYESDML